MQDAVAGQLAVVAGPGTEGIQGRGAAQAIHRQLAGKQLPALRQAGRFARGNPLGHGHRERNQQQHIADHGRVERVHAQATVELLGHNNGKAHPDQGQPPGGGGRQRQGQQHGGEHRTVVLQVEGHRATAGFQDQRLTDQRHHHGPQHIDDCAPAELPGQHRQTGQGGVNHLAHESAGVVAHRGVGRG